MPGPLMAGGSVMAGAVRGDFGEGGMVGRVGDSGWGRGRAVVKGGLDAI